MLEVEDKEISTKTLWPDTENTPEGEGRSRGPWEKDEVKRKV